MDEATLAHIFEPFYTTKPEGRGTGLGLATVYGIVQQNAGAIEAESQPGRGSTFRIHLPLALEPAQVETTEPARVQGGTETILLVEDEAALLEVAREGLASLGYLVLAAASGRQALDLAHAHPGKIDLLVTDVVMPEMNGQELSERLASLRPGVRCLFTSGYTADVISGRGVLEEGVRFLAKPYARDDLAAKVREALRA